MIVPRLNDKRPPRTDPRWAQIFFNGNLQREQQVGRHSSTPPAAVNRRHYGGEGCPTAV